MIDEYELMTDYETRYLKVITPVTTWVKAACVVWPNTVETNPVYEVGEEVITKEIVNAMRVLGYTDKYWEVQRWHSFYTQITKLNKEGLAGQWWLGLELWLKK